jgi:hypothetical protein
VKTTAAKKITIPAPSPVTPAEGGAAQCFDRLSTNGAADKAVSTVPAETPFTPNSPKEDGSWNKPIREAFLAALAESSNVSASAKKAGTRAARAYAERRKDSVFAAAWHKALCEGYARLEAELLAEALRPASGQIGENTLKYRAIKVRLGTTLLTLHRASVRGSGMAVLAPPPKRGEIRARLANRFAAMHDNMADHV